MSSLVTFHHYQNSNSTTYYQSRNNGSNGGRAVDGLSANEARDPSDFDRQRPSIDDDSSLEGEDQSLGDEGQCLPCFFSSALLGWLRRRLSGGSKNRVSVGMFEGETDDREAAAPPMRRSSPSLQPSDRTARSAPSRVTGDEQPEALTLKNTSLRSSAPKTAAGSPGASRKSKKTSGKATAASFAALSATETDSNNPADFPNLWFPSASVASVIVPSSSTASSPTASRRAQMKSELLVNTNGDGGKKPSNLLDTSGGGLYFGLQDSEPSMLYGYREGDDSTGPNDPDTSGLAGVCGSQSSDDGLDLPPLSSGYRTPPRGVGTNYEEGSSPNVMLSFRTAPSPSPLLGTPSNNRSSEDQLTEMSSPTKQQQQQQIIPLVEEGDSPLKPQPPIVATDIILRESSGVEQASIKQK
jgi:hypothetical protein